MSLKFFNNLLKKDYLYIHEKVASFVTTNKLKQIMKKYNPLLIENFLRKLL